jgi:threonine dehydrogenase-like Zn-dependent dehydrogenase
VAAVRPKNSSDTTLWVTGGVITIAVLAAWVLQQTNHGGGKIIEVIVAAGVIGLGIVAWARAFGDRRIAKAELANGEKDRRLADEYRRLADLAITAQEHTDLKLGEVSAQMDYMREQMESLQKILKEVE